MSGHRLFEKTNGELRYPTYSLRILHINNEKTWRGGERQTLLLAAALPDLGVEGAIGCRANCLLAERASAKGVPILPIAGDPLRASWKLARLASGFDLLHCHTGRGHSLAAGVSWVHSKPVVVTRRVDFLPKKTWFNRFKYTRAARVVCISEFIARQLADWGVPTPKIAVIRSAAPGTSKSLAPADPAALRAELRISPGRKLVGNIAALVGHKDHATFLKCAREVRLRRSDVDFVIIGDGELKAELLKLRAELGLKEAVHFAGFKSKAERFLPAFDVFVMSSCMEGLGSIVLDAFVAGVPVAATAGGGLPELVRSNETGLLAPVGDYGALADAAIRLLDEEALRKRMTEAARIWVNSECSVENMARQYQALYRSVLVGSEKAEAVHSA